MTKKELLDILEDYPDNTKIWIKTGYSDIKRNAEVLTEGRDGYDYEGFVILYED